MKNKKQRRVMLLLILILGITIGFALLSTTLKINGNASIKSNTWNIHWNKNSINVSEGSVEAETPVVSKATSNDDTVSFDVELELPGDFYEFEIDAINEGSIDGALDLAENWITYKIDNVEGNLPSYMDFKVTYDDNTTPTSGDVLKATESKTYKVRVEYKSSVEELPENPKPVTIEVNLPYIQHKTTGIKYNLGDLVYFDPVSEDKCDSTTFNLNNVKSGDSTCYKWRVITTNDTESKTNIKLQMDHNLVNKTIFCSGTAEPMGPVNIFAAFSALTSSWNRVPLLNYTYTYAFDETDSSNSPVMTCTNGTCALAKSAYSVGYGNNIRARVITMEEMIEITRTISPNLEYDLYIPIYGPGDVYKSIIYFSNNSNNIGVEGESDTSPDTSLSWLVENTNQSNYSGSTDNVYDDNNSGYWTMTPDYRPGGKYFAYYVQGSYGFTDTAHNASENYIGARPVVEINKDMITKD